MKQVTQQNRSGEVRVDDVPIPALKSGHVLVRTRYSVISAGTERASVSARQSSLVERARQDPDLVRKVLDQMRTYGLAQTMRRIKAQLNNRVPIGYSLAGVVAAVGEDVTGFSPKDRVACAGAGFANHAEFVLVPKNLCAQVPEGVQLEEAAYTTLGAIALEGVRQVDPTLGEVVVVIGLGLVGQLTVQLLKANGCLVVGIDLDPGMVKLARQCGADAGLERASDDVRRVIHSLTDGRGADAVVITAATPSNDPVQLAGEISREKGRVVLVGDVGLQLPRGPYFLKELDFRFSRSYGPGRYDPLYEERGQDYPGAYVRWTEQRNMQEYLRLVADRKVRLEKLTTHRFPIENAGAAYDLILGKARSAEGYVGIVLDYGEADRPEKPEDLSVVKLEEGPRRPSPRALGIGFLGAGSFAQASLLPVVRRYRGVELVGVCTGNGLNATNVGKNFGFQFATTDPQQVIRHEGIGTVFLAARHNLHARYAVEALRAGKNVFVEKPLALRVDELRDIISAYQDVQTSKGRSPILMAGFNRRFAPHIQQVKRFFENAVGPFALQYRVNAGYVPRAHWTQDPVEGGGRIIGEVCHFIDLFQFIAGSSPTRVFAEPLVTTQAGARDDDSVAITVRFENGSIGTITYLANGDPSVPKEYLEVFSTGRSALLDNFQVLTLYQQGKRRVFKRSTVDKGHGEELRQFLDAVKSGRPSPIPFESLVATTATTFRIVESLRLGVPVSL